MNNTMTYDQAIALIDHLAYINAMEPQEANDLTAYINSLNKKN